VAARLSKYTSRYDQAYDSATVTIGLHYVATPGGTSRVPRDSDSDSVPDYVADSDGNSIVDWTEQRRQRRP